MRCVTRRTIWRVRSRIQVKDSDLSVIQERVPAGAGEVEHFHTKARQFFYVLSGEATMEVDGKSVTFGPGQGIHVPPGVRHRFANNSHDDVVFLVISSPSTAGDRTNAPSAA
jgi:mannose-6-phosphate isomerase-like protein (cupin superfamily)